MKRRIRSHLLHVPRYQRHKLVQIVETELGTKFQTSDIVADAAQTVLRTKVVEHVLPSGIVVEFGPRHRLVVDYEIRPDARHVERIVPVAAHLYKRALSIPSFKTQFKIQNELK